MSGTNYLSLVENNTNDLKYAVLDAYIYGISKKLCGKTINGLGIVKGIKSFHDNFTSAYLLRNKPDVNSVNIDFYSTQDVPIIQVPVSCDILTF